jgi:hypothetical protein
VRELPPEVAAWGASAERPPYERIAPQPGNALATSSLVLSILGLVILLPTLGLGAPLAMPFSIAGWATGAIGRKQVADGHTAVGDGIAHAGVVLGIAGVVLGVIALVIWGILIAAGLDLDEFRRDLESGS